MIRFVFSVLLFLSTLIVMSPSQAQQPDTKHMPFLVPFRVDGKWGLMNTLGEEVKAPGFCKSIDIRDNFAYYVITDNTKAPRYWLIDSHTGKQIDLGELKSPNPVLKMDDAWFYHFEKENKTVLASPLTRESFTLDDRYQSIIVANLYDVKGQNKKNYLFAFDDNDVGCIISVTDHFKKVDRIPAFKRIDLISAIIKKRKSSRTFPIGFAVQKAKTDEDTRDRQVKIYDFQLAKIGEMPVSDSALTAAFGVKAALKSSLPVIIGPGGGIIKNGLEKDQSVKLNQEFEIKRLAKPLPYDAFRHVYYLIHKQRGQSYTELVSKENARFDWVFYRGNKLISIWFQRGGNNLKAYFDYNGIVLPKNKLMIPSKYYKGEEMKPFLFH